ncbi:MAG: hypothetical protein JNM31_12610 [Flavobacteriales bacterium]|nr:hypothetical protein [Flavobacteriales bacterium]
MSWKIALVVAVLTAVLTAIVTAPVADKVTRMHGASDFEGARGMFIAFVLLPAAFIGGFVLGLLGTRWVGAVEWAQFWKAAGLSVLLGQVALFGIAGISLLSIPRPPKALGAPLAIEVEVIVPLERIPGSAREPGNIRMSLYAGDRDNSIVPVDPALYREEEDLFIVPATAPLNSRTATRILSFHIEEHTWLAFDFPLPPTPDVSDAWTEPAPLRDARMAGSNTTLSDVRLRYRVVPRPAHAAHDR